MFSLQWFSWRTILTWIDNWVGSEGALVLVGIVTCLVIAVQSWYTRRSANAATESMVLTHQT